MKTKSLVIILLLMFFSSVVIADTVTMTIGESTPTELVQESAEVEGSESIDELKIFHHQLLTEDILNNSLHCFSETTVVLKTTPQSLYRPPNFS